jgi:glutathionylspermidine synthase
MENDLFIKNKEKYVKNPLFGREGDTVEIHVPLKKLKIKDEQKVILTMYLFIKNLLNYPKFHSKQKMEGSKVMYW